MGRTSAAASATGIVRAIKGVAITLIPPPKPDLSIPISKAIKIAISQKSGE
jgi:hypothetical protein